MTMPSRSQDTTEIIIPNFLAKLWKIVDDREYNHAISWDGTGFSFHILEPKSFSRDVLPLFFKHNNLSSFVRQLNMYGFRKVTPVDKSGLVQTKSDQEHLEFQHPYFVRGHPDMMQYIKRKITSNPGTSLSDRVLHKDAAVSGHNVNQILDEVKSLREKQLIMDSKLGLMKKENSSLWREVSHMRSLHMKQQQIVSRLIQFLLSVVQPRDTGGKSLSGQKRPLAIGPDTSTVSVSMPSDHKPLKRYKLVPIDETDDCPGTSNPGPHSTNSKCDGIIIADVTDEQNEADLGYSNVPYPSTTPNVSPLMTDVNFSSAHQNLEQNLEELDCLLASNMGNVKDNAGNRPPSPSQYMNELPNTSDGAHGWRVDERHPMIRQDLGDYLDNVDVDLNYLKELMNSQTLDLSDINLQSLMSEVDDQDDKNTVSQSMTSTSDRISASPAYPNPAHFSTGAEDNCGQIVGNELAVYQAPQNFVNESKDKTASNVSRPGLSSDVLDSPLYTPSPYSPSKNAIRESNKN